MNKFYAKKFIIVPLLFVIFFSFNFVKSYAAPDPCDIETLAFAPGKHWYDIDIRRTVNNMVVSIASTFFANTTGMNMTELVKCEGRLLEMLKCGRNPQGGLGYTGLAPCNDTALQARCDALITSSKTAYMDGKDPMSLLAINSSLWGVANRIENVTKSEPLVVNLAYYWNDQISHIPFVNKALAAPIEPMYKRLPILNAALSMWRIARNIALGMISIVLLYTGIMIILRKRVNPQLVVSVQYAIPKIVVGLILIIFSYPIGAAITGTAWALFRGAEALMLTLLGGAGSESSFSCVPPGTSISGLAFMAIIITGLKDGLAAFALVLLGIVTALIVVILKVVVQIKALIIYIKMVMSVITAPFEFALGTVPGSEDRIKDWFLRMAKYTLTVFAMGLVIPATLLMALEMVVAFSSFNPATGRGLATGAETGGMGTIMTIITPMIIIIFGFSLAIGMENTIDKLFFGGDRPKRK